MRLHLKLAAVTLLLSPFIAAQAMPMTFFGEDAGQGEDTVLSAFKNATPQKDAFVSHLSDFGVENFEGFADDTGGPLSIGFGSAGVTATLQDVTGVAGKVNAVANGTTDTTGRYGISGDPDGDGSDQYWEANGGFSIEFDSPVSAFGFYGVDIGDFTGQITVTIGGVTFNIGNATDVDGGGVLFWGIIAEDGFTKITFGNTDAHGVDYFGFDNFMVAGASQVNVPTPGALALLLAGFGLIGFGAAKRHRQSDDKSMFGA